MDVFLVEAFSSRVVKNKLRCCQDIKVSRKNFEYDHQPFACALLLEA